MVCKNKFWNWVLKGKNSKTDQQGEKGPQPNFRYRFSMFWPFGQLRSVLKKKFGPIVSNFCRRFLWVKNIWIIFWVKIGPQDLNPECKGKETLRQVLFYLFCDSSKKLGSEYKHSSISAVSISAIFNSTRFIILSYFPPPLVFASAVFILCPHINSVNQGMPLLYYVPRLGLT